MHQIRVRCPRLYPFRVCDMIGFAGQVPLWFAGAADAAQFGEKLGCHMVHRPYLSVWIFLALEAGLYAAFLRRDLQPGSGSTTLLKYGAIVLCLAFSCWWSARGGERLVSAALALTAGADAFLLVLNRWYAAGVLLFCGVQGLYCLRIFRENGGKSWWGLRLGLFLAAVPLLDRLGLLTPLNALAALYFTTFLCSVLQSLTPPGRRFRLFSAGLVLFLCCDVCVGIWNVPWLLSRGAVEFARVGMWLFYLPAQVLITLSGLPEQGMRGVCHENQ